MEESHPKIVARMADLYREISKPRTDFEKPSMGFEGVYSVLQSVFPEVDPRALKAVAIEHSKDVDVAVMAVMEEIIPFFTEKSIPISPLFHSIYICEPSDGFFTAKADTQKKECPLVETVGLAQFVVHNAGDGKQMPFGGSTIASSNDHPFNTFKISQAGRSFSEETKLVKDEEDVYMGEPSDGFFTAKADTQKKECPLVETVGLAQFVVHNAGDGKQMPFGGSTKVTSNDNPFCTFKISQAGRSFSEETKLVKDEEDVAGNSETDLESDPESSVADGTDLADETALLTSDDETVQHSEKSAQLVEVPGRQESNLDNSNACLPDDTASSPENTSNVVGTEDESSNLNATMSRSSEIHTIDVIEEIIADARNNKKTLFSAMENVISLMRQVEDKEKAAKLAKVEAADGGIDILNKVQELKQMLEYAKKGNSMDAGDVYGEKAILATELRELQSRVLSLSDERDESLAVLDEMRQTLEVRLAAAENEIESAEQEKLEKENAARMLFVDQELVMEKVVQESKNLKQLAEENAKLQEFLTDRGRTVDELQGELGAICQDVRLLKEKFDLRLPLSKSHFPSKTSFVLASSNSSLEKSLVPDEVPVGDDDIFETQKNRDHEQVLDEEATEDDRKALEDEGWEFYVDDGTVA